MVEHFAVPNNEYIVEKLRALEQALSKRCKNKKLAKDVRRGLNFAHLIVLEMLMPEQKELCRYTMQEQARKVMNCKPKGFNKAWNYITKQVQGYIDENTQGAEP